MKASLASFTSNSHALTSVTNLALTGRGHAKHPKNDAVFPANLEPRNERRGNENDADM